MSIIARLIYNPASGSNRWQSYLPEIQRIFESHDWRIDIFQTRQRGDVARLAGEAVQNNCEVVLVAGGDGSLNEAVNVLVHTPCALGVLPTGTGNVWARQIGMPIPSPLTPNRLNEAAICLTEAQVRTIDLGRVAQRYFLLWSGVGLDGDITASIEPKPMYIRRLGLLGYATQVIFVATRYRGTRIRIQTDQRLIRTRAILAVASNGPLYAAILKIAPQACLDDGALDLVVFKGDNFISTIFHAFHLLADRVERNPRAIVLRARRIEINTPRPSLVEVDGEPILRTPVTIEVVPHSLRVLIPRDAPSKLFQQPPGT